MLTYMRPVQWTDAAPLYVWRTDVETKKWSTTPPPTWDAHIRWLNSKLSAPHSLYIGEHDGLPVVALELRGDVVNIMTNPAERRKGYAAEAIRFAQRTARHLVAHIKFGNTASLKLFAKCGFVIVATGEHNGGAYITMEWETCESLQ